MIMKRKELKKKNIIQLFAVIIILLSINLLAEIKFFRVDLTSEKRFSLSAVTKTILRELKEPLFIKIYLAGELPSDLEHFKRSLRETLDEFRAYGRRNVQYSFINLYDEPDETIRNNMMRDLADKGLRVTDVRIKSRDGGFTTKIIFPGAVVSFRGTDFPVNLLKNNPALPYHINLNNSIQSFEFEFIRAIKSLISEKLEKVAFIEGHNELNYYEVFDLSKELSLFFQVDRGAIQGNVDNLLEYKALIIAQPLNPFNEADKFAIDQYIMHGGNVLFFLDPVKTSADSLVSGKTFTSFTDLNIYDLLFKYGFRIDYNLVKDIQCSYVKVESTIDGRNPTVRLMPWWYFPLLTAKPDHPVTRGLNYIIGKYISVIDTTSALIPGIQRTVLLSTSDSSARIDNPVMISMDEVTQMPDRKTFNKSKLPIVVLAEGVFESFYKNYGIPEGVTSSNTEIIKESVPARILVAGDGDLLRNEVQISGGEPIPMSLGYDADTRQTFGNKEFLMNVINYMTDDYGLISLRQREFKLRLLDRSAITTSSQKLKWKIINIVFPITTILLFAFLFSWLRKRKYGSKITYVK